MFLNQNTLRAESGASMFVVIRAVCISFLLALLTVFYTGSRAIAQVGVWHVSKSSGDVWVTNLGAQKVMVTSETILSPGDSIRTGQTGRVLLIRGEESILISANSVIGIPSDKLASLVIIRMECRRPLFNRPVRFFSKLKNVT